MVEIAIICFQNAHDNSINPCEIDDIDEILAKFCKQVKFYGYCISKNKNGCKIISSHDSPREKLN